MSLSSRRRGACPALSAPMQTGDGLLVRINPEEGLSPQALTGLAAAAAAFGNGILEVTARGSLQLRGLRPETVAPLTEAVTALAIRAREGLAIDMSPLSGLDAGETGDARALAAALRRGLAEAGFADRLGPKVSVVIEGGGAIALDALKADVRLSSDGGLWRMTPDIEGREAAALDADAAIRDTLALLARIAARGPAARMSDVTDVPAAPDAPRAAAAPGRPLPLKDGTFALPVALPFGAMEHGAIAGLAQAAARHGAADLRPAPPRLLLAVGLSGAAVDGFARAAAALGFICDPADPRLFVAACAGAPACASGHLPARALAAEVAEALASVLDSSHTVHLSGCEKGCAHPAPAWLTLIGRANCAGMDSAAALVRHGTAASPAHGLLPLRDLPARLAAAVRRGSGEGAPGAAAEDLVNSLLAGASLERNV